MQECVFTFDEMELLYCILSKQMIDRYYRAELTIVHVSTPVKDDASTAWAWLPPRLGVGSGCDARRGLATTANNQQSNAAVTNSLQPQQHSQPDNRSHSYRLRWSLATRTYSLNTQMNCDTEKGTTQ